jgi:two-component system phosphate regulon sensor histidine kinase PhoR
MTAGRDVSAEMQAALEHEASLARLLLGAARLLGETLVPERVYEQFREILADAVKHDGCIVSSYDPDDGTIRCEYAWADGKRLDETTFPPLRLSPEGGMQSEVIRTGRPLLTNDVAQRVQGPGTYYDVDASGELRKVPDDGPPDAEAAIMVPVKHEGTVVGVVQVMTDSGRYTRDDLDVVEGLVGQMAAAVRNARLHQERAQLEVREAAAQAAAQEREQAARVLAAVGEGIVLVDDAGAVAYRNPAAERLGADGFDWPALAGRIGERATLPVEIDGQERWLAFVAVGTPGGVVYAFRDVTHERELESAKNDFIATVSHELRTPMTAVLGAAKTLLRDDVSLSEEQRRELLEMIAAQATRLANVTEDVLLASRLDRGDLRIEREPLDIDDVVRETAQAHAPAAELVLGGTEIVGDRDRVQQVLVNLLDNAAKYGGGRVLVSTETSDGVVHVAVADDGHGLDADEQERVFEKFFRADPQLARQPGGTGLGLYICKELVERMGGRIGVASRPGAGTTFWFELPAR